MIYNVTVVLFHTEYVSLIDQRDNDTSCALNLASSAVHVWDISSHSGPLPDNVLVY